jgi:hypothetical protein
MTIPPPNERYRAFGALIVIAVVLATPLNGQRGAADSARLSRVIAGVRSAGYARAALIGHGAGTADALFVLSAAARGGSGVLLVTVEPGGSGVHPVVLERARTPADLGVHDVRFTSFLGTRDLFDVEVRHQPFMLETNRTFSTHHVLRRQGDALSAVCDLDGGSSSSYSKGIGSNTTTREVTITRVPGTVINFSVRMVAKTVQRHDRDAAPTIDSTISVRWYEVPVVGPCREVRAPKLSG